MKLQARMPIPLLFLCAIRTFAAEGVCEVASPTASFSVPHVAEAPELNTDPHSAAWSHTVAAWIEKDCTHSVDYPKLKTEVRGFWTDSDLYLLFICPYTELNLWLPADNSKDRLKLWDRDVVEFFLGDDWTDIRHYREFEIAPTGDWVDLAIDLDKHSYGAQWNSGYQKLGRIDETNHVWYAAARVSTAWERIRSATSCAGSRRAWSTVTPITCPSTSEL
jgi:hypothetical protein